MNESAIALWLDRSLYHFDFTVLSLLHKWALQTQGVLSSFLEIIGLLSEKGVGMFLLGILLLCFKKTRKAGLCVFGAVCCGAFLSNLLLKNLIGRPRPFENHESLYYQWWLFVGAMRESGYSFPSGHTTAAMAAMTALFFFVRKEAGWLLFVFVLLTGLSRCYFMVHYPSDVLAALLVGFVAAGCSFVLTRILYPRIDLFIDKFLKRGRS
jgi:undecaprenyl-diphosphatase